MYLIQEIKEMTDNLVQHFRLSGFESPKPTHKHSTYFSNLKQAMQMTQDLINKIEESLLSLEPMITSSEYDELESVTLGSVNSSAPFVSADPFSAREWKFDQEDDPSPGLIQVRYFLEKTVPLEPARKEFAEYLYSAQQALRVSSLGIERLLSRMQFLVMFPDRLSTARSKIEPLLDSLGSRNSKDDFVLAIEDLAGGEFLQCVTHLRGCLEKVTFDVIDKLELSRSGGRSIQILKVNGFLNEYESRLLKKYKEFIDNRVHDGKVTQVQAQFALDMMFSVLGFIFLRLAEFS